MDISSTIIPKSDQLNSDDLIAGPRTVRITRVTGNQGEAEQPVSVYFDGDGGKPYKPCKSMRRVMVFAWGANAANYVGRSMTLYRDPSVKWGGMEVGGIRISHMSHIDKTLVMALTATKGSRKPYTVRPLETRNTDRGAAPPAAAQDAGASPAPSQAPASAPPVKDRLLAQIARFDAASDLLAWWDDPRVLMAVAKLSSEDSEAVSAAYEAKVATFTADDDGDDFPGDVR